MNTTKSLSAVLLTICSLICFCTAAAQGQKRRAVATTIREVKNAEASVPAPRACFLYEDGAWKLDDIYTFRGAYVSAESLSQYFREK